MKAAGNPVVINCNTAEKIDLGGEGNVFTVNFILRRNGVALTTISSQGELTVNPNVNLSFSPGLAWCDTSAPKGEVLYTIDVERIDNDQLTTIDLGLRIFTAITAA